MRRKGFTLVELLVVIAIIAMLLAILMPALAKVKTLAYQMLCGTNLKGIANAILVYGQDNSEKYPVAGVAGVRWNNDTTQPYGYLRGGNNVWDWDNPAKPSNGTGSTNSGGINATVSSCLYLLVKYADVSPASFVCKASKQKKFNVLASQAEASEKSSYTGTDKAKDPVECWDFSNVPSRYCSYAYAYPWDTAKLMTSSSKSGVAVAGDLNPWIQPNAPDTTDPRVKFVGPAGTSPVTDAPQLITVGTRATWIAGNSLTHEQAGQNVLFNDMHVEFSKQPNPDSAIQNDNIYTPFDTAQSANAAYRQKGKQPANIGTTDTLMRPWTKEDSYLVQW